MHKILPFIFIAIFISSCKTNDKLEYSTHPSLYLIDSLDCYTLNTMYNNSDELDDSVCYYLSLIETKCGDLDKAEFYIKRSISLDKDRPYKNFAFANILSQKGSYKEAYEEIIKAHKAYKNNYYILIQKAEIEYNLEKSKSCLRTLDHIESNNDQLSDSYRLKSLVYRLEQKNDKSLKYLNEAIDLSPEDSWLYYLAGDLLIIDKHYKEAIPYLIKATELETDNAEYLFRRGVAFYYSGEKEKAASDWSESLKLGHSRAQEYIDTYLN